MVAVTALTLSHFRSHRVVRLTLDPRPVALFGANGVGKTNILEAVSLLSMGRGLRRAAADDMVRRPEAIGWKIKADVAGHVVETWAEPGQARSVRIDGKAATQVALGGLVRALWLIPAMDRLWIEGADGRRRFLDRMALSFIPEHGGASLTYEKTMRERNRLLKDQVRDSHWYTAIEGRMADAAAAIVRHRALTVASLEAAQADAETAFPAADLALTHAEGPMPESAEDFRSAWAEGRRQDLYAGRTLIGPHRADLEAVYTAKGVPAKDCSTGEQKALLVSLILANARALAAQIGHPPLLLLDEVTAHLDADRQAALYDELCALDCQAWMTGTGPEMFAALGERAQRFLVTEAEGESAVVPA
ncbi:MAG: DNA replication/repair protein RecF [Shimia sp.]